MPGVVPKIIHYYNNTVSVNDVAKSEKQNDDLSHDEFDSNDALDFDDDVLQKAY